MGQALFSYSDERGSSTGLRRTCMPVQLAWEARCRRAGAPAMVVPNLSFRLLTKNIRGKPYLYAVRSARVNGKPGKIWRANHAFQAVEIPAGRSQVQFTYQEKHLILGAIFSGTTLIGCIIGWFASLRGTRASERTASNRIPA